MQVEEAWVQRGESRSVREKVRSIRAGRGSEQGTENRSKMCPYVSDRRRGSFIQNWKLLPKMEERGG